jgi:poly(3-hydroxybutyrate) depolymerase
VYGRVQAQAAETLTMVKKVADVSKFAVVALGRNNQGWHARLGDKGTPVCQVVLNLLSVHFAVVLIDEYQILTSQMCFR